MVKVILPDYFGGYIKPLPKKQVNKITFFVVDQPFMQSILKCLQVYCPYKFSTTHGSGYALHNAVHCVQTCPR